MMGILDSITLFLDENQNAIAGFTALAALILSTIGIFTSWLTLKQNDSHNRKSVTPIGEITYGDFSNLSSVALINKGIGPLIVTNLTYKFEGVRIDGLVFQPIVDYLLSVDKNWLKQRGIQFKWSRVLEMEQRALSANSSQTYFRIAYITNDEKGHDERALIELRNTVRMLISKSQVIVHYVNIYKGKEPRCEFHGAMTQFANARLSDDKYIPKTTPIKKSDAKNLTFGSSYADKHDEFDFI